MIKKIFTIGFTVLIVLIVLLLFTKDNIATYYVTQNLAKSLPGKFSLSKAVVSVNSITLRDVTFSNDQCSISAKNGSARFWFTKNLEPYLTWITLDDASIELKNIAAPVQVTSGQGITGSSSGLDIVVAPKKPLHFSLKNISIRYAGTQTSADVAFSCDAVLYEQGVLRIKALEVRDLNLKSKDFSIAHLAIKQLSPTQYELSLPLSVIHEKEIRNLVIPVRIQGDRLTVERAGNRFLGNEAYFEGNLDFSDYRNICFAINFHRCSFEKVLPVLIGDNKVTIEGFYGGKLLCCLEGARITNIESYLYDMSGGLVNIKDDKSLDFLRPYLDQKSYNALVDNLQKYRYNKGKITVRKDKADILLEMHFESADLGERNVSINFHNLLGGNQ